MRVRVSGDATVRLTKAAAVRGGGRGRFLETGRERERERERVGERVGERESGSGRL